MKTANFTHKGKLKVPSKQGTCTKCLHTQAHKTSRSAIKYNYIKDCPVTVADIEAAEKILGKDIHALKGKTVRKAPYRIQVDTVAVPEEILKLHKKVVLGIDYIFINGLAFFHYYFQ